MDEDEESNVEYVPEQLEAIEAFSDVFARFKLPEEPTVRLGQVSLSLQPTYAAI